MNKYLQGAEAKQGFIIYDDEIMVLDLCQSPLLNYGGPS